ncbi:sulfatase [Candidatus Latescibacterota bacterium]
MSQFGEINISRREMLKRGLTGAAGIGGLSFLESCDSVSAQKRLPNVILIQTDDQNFDTLGCYGADVHTPNFDRLAREGVRFNRAYTTSAVCVASRYGCMTGQFPSRCLHPQFTRAYPDGVQTEPSFNTPLLNDLPNLANVLQNAGYRTGMVGKWHLGSGTAKTPKERGELPLPITRDLLSTWVKGESNIDPADPEIDTILEHNYAVNREEIKSCGFDYAESFYRTNPEGFQDWTLNFHNMEWIAQGALDFIGNEKDNPFFLYMNTTLHHIPHPQTSLLQGDPRITPAGYLDKAPDCMPPREEVMARVERAGFAPETAYCTWLDDAIGAVTNKLSELNIADDTLIIIISDHQTPAKGTIYEGGVNAPCIIKWANGIPAGQVCGGLAQNLDFTPTIFEACGVEKPANMMLDGKSLLPMLTGKTPAVHDELFFELGWTRAVCTLDMKYLALRYPESALERARTRKKPNYHAATLEPHQHNVLLWHPAFWEPDQLYNLSSDPDEVVNLADDPEYADEFRDLQGRLIRWLATFGDHPFGELAG